MKPLNVRGEPSKTTARLDENTAPVLNYKILGDLNSQLIELNTLYAGAIQPTYATLKVADPM